MSLGDTVEVIFADGDILMPSCYGDRSPTKESGGASTELVEVPAGGVVEALIPITCPDRFSGPTRFQLAYDTSMANGPKTVRAHATRTVHLDSNYIEFQFSGAAPLVDDVPVTLEVALGAIPQDEADRTWLYIRHATHIEGEPALAVSLTNTTPRTNDGRLLGVSSRLREVAATGGEVRVLAKTKSGRALVDECHVELPPKDDAYLILEPGKRLRSFIPLRCFALEKGEVGTFKVIYEDTGGFTHLKDLRWIPVLKRRIESNAVTVAVNGECGGDAPCRQYTSPPAGAVEQPRR